MPSSWTQNFYHAVFSTKNRVEAITPEIEERLYPFLGGVLKDLRAQPLAINGMPDHVHICARYPSDLSHSDMLKHLKSRSSKWMHRTFPSMCGVSWQDGYGGFTVSKSKVEDVVAYIRRQKEHHKAQTYIDEARELCRLNGIEISDEELFG